MSTATNVTERVKQAGFDDGFHHRLYSIDYANSVAHKAILDAIAENGIPYTKGLEDCFVDTYKEAFQDGQYAAAIRWGD